jgi:hypothetical protein
MVGIFCDGERVGQYLVGIVPIATGYGTVTAGTVNRLKRTRHDGRMAGPGFAVGR